jgi:CRISPR-associated protein Cmr6
MTQPTYQGGAVQGPGSGKWHGGLWFERFFNRYTDASFSDVGSEGKKSFLSGFSKLHGDQHSLDLFSKRQTKLVNALKGDIRVYRSDWRWVTGMGLPHPVENGISWHTTLGVPFLPGSAVKGLVRAALTALEKPTDFISRVLGPLPDASSGDAGLLMFFDAVPTEMAQLVVDVMTPHAGDWYKNPTVAPADWHAPNPVPFLTVAPCSLLFSIAPHPRSKISEEEMTQVWEALDWGLAYLGAGAKSSVGYGFMTLDNKATEGRLDDVREQAAEAEFLQLSEEQQALSLLEQQFTITGQLQAGSELAKQLNHYCQQADNWPSDARKQLADLTELFYQKTSWGPTKKKKDRKAVIARLRT